MLSNVCRSAGCRPGCRAGVPTAVHVVQAGVLGCCSAAAQVLLGSAVGGPQGRHVELSARLIRDEHPLVHAHALALLPDARKQDCSTEQPRNRNGGC